MREFIYNLLGEYTPVTYEHIESYWNGSESWDMTTLVIPDGLAGVDWAYVLTGLLLIVIVYSFFKTLGGIICRIF